MKYIIKQRFILSIIIYLPILLLLLILGINIPEVLFSTKNFAFIIIFMILAIPDIFFCIDYWISKTDEKTIVICDKKTNYKYSILAPSKKGYAEIIYIIDKNREKYCIANNVLEDFIKSNDYKEKEINIKYIKTFRGRIITDFEI